MIFFRYGGEGRGNVFARLFNPGSPAPDPIKYYLLDINNSTLLTADCDNFEFTFAHWDLLKLSLFL